jgi:ABC-type nitrate/sulfonate/bicarbonate transport system substrate-binding protein
VGLLSWMLAGCGGEEGAPPGPNVLSPTQPLRIGLAMRPQSALTLIAREQGYFRQHGIDAQFHEYPSGNHALNEGLLAGKVEVAVASNLPVVMAAINGKDFTLLATAFNADNLNSIITPLQRISPHAVTLIH